MLFRKVAMFFIYSIYVCSVWAHTHVNNDHVADLVEQRNHLGKITNYIKYEYDTDKLRSYIEEQLRSATAKNQSLIISRFLPLKLKYAVVPSQDFYLGLLHESALTGRLPAVTILAPVCADDRLFEQIKAHNDYDSQSAYTHFINSKLHVRVIMMLFAVDVINSMIYNNIDMSIYGIFETISKYSFVLGVLSCYFPIVFTAPETNTPAFNASRLLAARTAANGKGYTDIASYLSSLCQQDNLQSDLVFAEVV